MEVTVSAKYQIVIPRAARKQLGLRPGQKLDVSQVNKTLIIDTESVVEKYAGALTKQWGSKDPAEAIRRTRDKDRT